MIPTYLSLTARGVRLKVHVQPGARQNEIVGLHGDALKIKVKAPPEDGKANAELCAFVAKQLGLAKSKVMVESGSSSRSKVLLVEGTSVAFVANCLVDK